MRRLLSVLVLSARAWAGDECNVCLYTPPETSTLHTGKGGSTTEEGTTQKLAQPLFTGELFYATEDEARYEGPGGARALATRKVESLSDAILFTTTPALFRGEARQRFERLEASVRLSRYGTDCYAFAMVAAGSVDIVADPGLKPYDIVALIPIIEKAGGVVTTFDGGPAEKGGDILAAATPELHAAAMAVLRG